MVETVAQKRCWLWKQQSGVAGLEYKDFGYSLDPSVWNSDSAHWFTVFCLNLMLSQALRRQQGTANLSEDMQGHEPWGMIHALLAPMLCPVQSMRLVSGKADLQGLYKDLHRLKCIIQSWEWKFGLQSSVACYDNSSHHSLNCVISVFLVDEPCRCSPAVGVGVLVSW